MAVNLSPVGGAAAQFLTNSGAVLTGGKIFTYLAGTTTPVAAYTTSQGNVPWTNPIVLDAAGRVPSGGEIWLTDGVVYKFLLKDANDVLIATYDDVSGINDVNASQVVYTAPYTNSIATNVEAKLAQTVSVKDFGAVGNGIADDTAAIQNAINAVTGGGRVFCPAGTYKVTSQIVVAVKVSLLGEGYAVENGTGAGYRGASCILRAFGGSDATVALNNEACGIDMLDVDNNSQGTGDGVQVWGSRVHIGTISTRNSGGDGVRIGKTEAGPTTVNCNFWKIDYLITCGNAKNGLRIDQTNTSTTASYPLGLSDCNAGYCGLLDARSNGEDGLQLGNCNDNVFANVGSQANAGIGIHFKTDGVNSGPRCNTILSNDSEANVGNDIQIDAATLPAVAPGLYNRIWGNRSVALNPRIVDNSTGSSIYTWNAIVDGYAWNSRSSVYESSNLKFAALNFYQGAGINNVAEQRAFTEPVGTGGRWELWTKRNGNTPAMALAVNSYGVLIPQRAFNSQTVNVTTPIDAAAGVTFLVDVTSSSAFAISNPTNVEAAGQTLTICLKNTSGGAMGTVTWGTKYKMASWTSPANGYNRSITFFYDGTNWIESSRTTADVPN